MWTWWYPDPLYKPGGILFEGPDEGANLLGAKMMGNDARYITPSFQNLYWLVSLNNDCQLQQSINDMPWTIAAAANSEDAHPDRKLLRFWNSLKWWSSCTSDYPMCTTNEIMNFQMNDWFQAESNQVNSILATWICIRCLECGALLLIYQPMIHNDDFVI